MQSISPTRACAPIGLPATGLGDALGATLVAVGSKDNGDTKPATPSE